MFSSIFVCLLINIEFNIDWPGSQWTSSHDIHDSHHVTMGVKLESPIVDFSQGLSFLVFIDRNKSDWVNDMGGSSFDSNVLNHFRSLSSEVRRKLICLHLTIISPYFDGQSALSNYKSCGVSGHFMIFNHRNPRLDL